MELLARNNPNILELLAAPEDTVLYRHPVMDALRSDLVLSKLCRDTFAGYAMTQVRKARGYNKKVVNPVEAERRNVIDFCYVVEGASSRPLHAWLEARHGQQERCGLAVVPHSKGLYALYYDADASLGFNGVVRSDESNEISLSSIPKGTQLQAHLFFNAEAYSSYCKSYREYWDWVAKRNEARYAGNRAHGKDYDAKNLMHTIRLLEVAEEVLRTGALQVRRPNREALLAIKRGEHAYDDLLAMAEGLMTQIDAATDTSPLPDAPDRGALNAVLVRMREELYKS